MKFPAGVGRRRGVVAGFVVAALALSACQEQEGNSTAATTLQTRQAQSGGAIVQVARAAEPRANAPKAGASSASELEAYLARIRQEARRSRQQALQMREQVIIYKESVAEVRELAAKYREDILRIRADIARERAEMEKSKAEINALLKDISAQAARIRADRDYLRQLAEQTRQTRQQILLIRQSVQQMRDDMLPKSALTTSSVTALRKAPEKRSASKSVNATPVTGLSLSPAGNQPQRTAQPSSASGTAAVKVRVPTRQQ